MFGESLIDDQLPMANAVPFMVPLSTHVANVERCISFRFTIASPVLLLSPAIVSLQGEQSACARTDRSKAYPRVSRVPFRVQSRSERA